jgi:hypothetical protein
VNRREKAQKSQNKTQEKTGFSNEESSAVAGALADWPSFPHSFNFLRLFSRLFHFNSP